jgi:drug/metabolite transporter superfamily protein YnfA
MIRALALLIGAAILEVGGDALMRRGMESRSWLLAAGALSLVVYGVVVNKGGFDGGLDFGRLMGAYIAVFFVVSQIIAVIFYREMPALRTIAGGALIIAGGYTIIG